MSTVGADVNLLFGILALQVDFIDRDALIDGMQAWSMDKSKSLGEILIERGALQPDQREPIELLVQAHLKNSNNDPEKSLVEVTSAFGIPDELSQIEDGEIEHTLSHVSSASISVPVFSAPPKEQDQRFGRSSSDSGRFERVELHEEGGLGMVWIANDKELDRKVAIKEMKERYADDEASRKRFVLEAEVTGGLEHPGVVPVYGYGNYEDGRPFYAMRFVRGKSLKEAIADFHRRDFSKQRTGARTVALRRLLDRFLDVCNTIYFAHRRGILHRDIKPSNVMMGEYGETLVVDWGLAKSVDRSKSDEVTDSNLPVESTLLPRSGSSVVQTMMGHAIGSPPYMSPEQARGEQDQLGPGTDIYSLGATLYTILTNARPIDGTTTDEILRRVREGDWKHPRSVKPDVPAALAAICTKAMALRPSDRYPSVRRLARDIEQYLADEPVSAYRESWLERGRRLGRRHRSLVLAGLGALFAVTVISLAAAVLVNAQRIKAQSLAAQKAELAVAESNAKDDALLQRREAIAAKERSDRVRNFLTDIIRSANPEQRGGQVTVVEMLDSVQKIDERFADDPLLCSEMLRVIGETYLSLGEYSTALGYARESYDLSNSVVGAEHANTIDSMQFLATAQLAAGKRTGALANAKKLYKLRVAHSGAESPGALDAKHILAKAYLGGTEEEYKKASELLENVYAEQRHTLGDANELTLQTATDLAEVFIQAQRFEDAVDLAQNAYRAQTRTLGVDHPLTLRTMSIAASALEYSGNVDRAIEMHQAAVAAKKAKLGDLHHDTVKSEFALTMAFVHAKRWEDVDRMLAVLRKKVPSIKESAGRDNALATKIVTLSALNENKLLGRLEKRQLVSLLSTSKSVDEVQTFALKLMTTAGGVRGKIAELALGQIDEIATGTGSKLTTSNTASLLEDLLGSFSKREAPTEEDSTSKDSTSSPADDILTDERSEDLGDDD